MQAAGYIALITVMTSLLFFMTLLPLYVDARVAREQRRSRSAPAVEDRHLRQAEIQEHADDDDHGQSPSQPDDDALLSRQAA